MSRQPLVVGVDGGGTKSIALVADPSGNVLARREGGASNVNVVGLDGAARTLHKVIVECCDDLHCTPDELSATVLALAGAGDESNRKRITEAIAGLFAQEGRKPPPMVVESDARAALEGALGGGPGVVVIAGTGSVVIGKTARGDLLTAGGWGRILGDEGSGYFLGREAVRAVSLLLDRRGGATMLREKLAATHQWRSRQDLIKAVYQDKFELSRLAPLVLEAAGEGDLVSQRILQQAATLLADQVRVVVMHMGILRKIALVMLGGLIDHENVYSNTLHMKLLKVLPQVDVRPPMHSPAHGAVLMALELLRKR